MTFKTSMRLTEQDDIDDFRSLGHLYGKRPHELAAEMVTEAIKAAREVPKVAGFLDEMRAVHEQTRQPPLDNVIDLEGRRR